MNSSPRPRICPMCKATFSDKAALASHMRSKHVRVANGPRRQNLSGVTRQTTPKSVVNYDGSARIDTVANARAALSGFQNPRTGGIRVGFREMVSHVLGSTQDGKAWALAALHPCGAGEVSGPDLGACKGMCDTMTGSVATPIWRGESHLSYNPSLFADTPSAPTTYGIDIIIPPVPEIDFMYRLIDDSTGRKTPWVVTRIPDFSLPEVGTYAEGGRGYKANEKFETMSSAGYGKVRQIACGHTIELDAAGLNNQGRIVVGQMEGQWNFIPLNSTSVTVNRADFVTSVGPPVTTASAVTSLTAYGATEVNGMWSLYIPTDPSTIVANCPNAYQGLAKDGAYVVTKFTSPLLGYAFKRSGKSSSFDVGDDETSVLKPFLPQSSLSIQTNTSLVNQLVHADQFSTYLPTGENPGDFWSAFGDQKTWLADLGGPIPQNFLHPAVSEPSDMMTAVICVRNLPTGTTNGNTSSLRIKSRNYYECISNGTNAAVAPYVHPPANFDFSALNSVIVAGKQLGDAYPASANSLGSIFGSIWGALKGLISPITKTVAGAGIPIVSDIAGVADNVIDTLHRVVV